MPSKTVEERFWGKVAIGAPDDCWEWQGGKDKDGYGSFKAKRQCRAHRYAYELTNGPIPEGMVICHSCDNPSCVNPAHLWAGSQRENIRDAVQKGHMNPWEERADGTVVCRKGHVLTPELVWRQAKGRRCAVCRRATQRASYEREKARNAEALDPLELETNKERGTR